MYQLVDTCRVQSSITRYMLPGLEINSKVMEGARKQMMDVYTKTAIQGMLEKKREIVCTGRKMRGRPPKNPAEKVKAKIAMQLAASQQIKVDHISAILAFKN